MLVTERKIQNAYDKKHEEREAQSTDQRVYQAMFTYLRSDLGLPEPVARDRAQAEIDGRIERSYLDYCEQQGLTFAGKVVLDLGSGLGGLALEALRRGASVVALEPGAAWREIAKDRIAEFDKGLVIGAVGESVPLADNSVDLILSRQVLEHVQDPAQVIREAFRVLRPSGYFYFSYENYLSFYEPHYKVRWLPLLPKKIGAAYLARLNRDPQFLMEAIHYTTFPAVRGYLKRTGFRCTRADAFEKNLSNPQKTSLKWKACKAVASLSEGAAVGLLTAQDFLSRTYKTGIYELVRKPG